MLRPAKILMTLELFDLISQFIPEEVALIWSWGADQFPTTTSSLAGNKVFLRVHSWDQHIHEVDTTSLIARPSVGRDKAFLQDRQDQIDDLKQDLAAPPHQCIGSRSRRKCKDVWSKMRRGRNKLVAWSGFLIKFSWTVKPKYFKPSFPRVKGLSKANQV